MARKKTGEGKPPKSDGDKAASFQRLAEARVNKALKAIQQISHLANPSAYVYTEEQVSTVLGALETAVGGVKATFANPSAAKSAGFKL